ASGRGGSWGCDAAPSSSGTTRNASHEERIRDIRPARPGCSAAAHAIWDCAIRRADSRKLHRGRPSMKREQLTEKILDIKRDNGWTWKHITTQIGGVSPVLVVGALLGQMKLIKPLARKAAALFGLSPGEEKMLNEVPHRGSPMPPTDPLLYRFYEL